MNDKEFIEKRLSQYGFSKVHAEITREDLVGVSDQVWVEIDRYIANWPSLDKRWLYLVGGPGCGKTSIMSIICRNIMQHPKASLGSKFFYAKDLVEEIGKAYDTKSYIEYIDNIMYNKSTLFIDDFDKIVVENYRYVAALETFIRKCSENNKYLIFSANKKLNEIPFILKYKAHIDGESQINGILSHIGVNTDVVAF